MNALTLFSALERAAALNREGTGFRYLDRHERETMRSFPDLAQRAARIAGGLKAAGVGPGDTVAIILPTTPAFTDVFFAATHLGAIPVPLYPPVRLGRLDEYFVRTAQMLDQAGSRVLVTDNRAGKLMGSVVAAASGPIQILRVVELEDHPPAPAAPPDVDDIAMVQFSSGTTGEPKPVALTHAQVIANASVILDIEPDDDDFCPSGVSWLPLYHDMGLIGCVFPALLYPGELTLIPPEAFLAKPALWLRALSRYRGLISPAPNFGYALCTERIEDDELDGVDLSGWRFALNGAEPTSPDTMRAFTERFAAWGLRSTALTPVYGLSEAALAVTFGALADRFTSHRFCPSALGEGIAELLDDGMELASVGRPLRGFGVEIRNETGAVQDGQIGQIWVSGPSIMDRYLDGSPPPRDGGWLDTGDLGFIFEGELYITGRAKDVLVIRGRNHDPATLEAALDDIAGVRTGCSAAVAQISGTGEQILLFIETRGVPASGLAETCEQAVQAATGVRPNQIILLSPGTLPRTSSGKIRRAETLRRWKQGELTAPESVGVIKLTQAVVQSAWSEWRDRPRRHD
jgi:fatty-acyl-CoA synthase